MKHCEAYCFRDGTIQINRSTPRLACVLAVGPEATLRAVLGKLCGPDWHVAGLDVANDEHAIKLVNEFSDRMMRTPPLFKPVDRQTTLELN